MKKIFGVLLFIPGLLLCSKAFSNSGNNDTACQCIMSYADAVEKAAPAIVSIQTTKHVPLENHPLLQDPLFKHFFADQLLDNPNSKQQGLGSGVIIDDSGHILTNNHVIKGTSSIQVKLSDGRIAPARLVGADEQSDLAILKIMLKPLPKISLGSSSSIRVGDIVLAVGNPFGLSQTVTQGIISAVAPLSVRTGDSSSQGTIFDELIQTDADINPGNSGGGLFDINGNLIGINMAILTATGASNGIGFAIPIDAAKDIMQHLINKGYVSRGWLGAHLRGLSPQMRKYLNYEGDNGVYVQAIVRGSPAQRAGLLPGDIIMSLDGKKVYSIHDAVGVIRALEPNKNYVLNINRKGEEITFSVEIGSQSN